MYKDPKLEILLSIAINECYLLAKICFSFSYKLLTLKPKKLKMFEVIQVYVDGKERIIPITGTVISALQPLIYMSNVGTHTRSFCLVGDQ